MRVKQLKNKLPLIPFPFRTGKAAHLWFFWGVTLYVTDITFHITNELETGNNTQAVGSLEASDDDHRFVYFTTVSLFMRHHQMWITHHHNSYNRDRELTMQDICNIPEIMGLSTSLRFLKLISFYKELVTGYETVKFVFKMSCLPLTCFQNNCTLARSRSNKQCSYCFCTQAPP